MITIDDIVSVTLSEKQIAVCKEHAEKCSLGGVSRIREDINRKENLNEDQIIGQICTCAATMWISSSKDRGFRYYDRIRTQQNKNPNCGDGGDDLPPYRVDIKGSKVRNPNKDILTYNLLVRPAERHNDWIYILALSDYPEIKLIGWIYDIDLPNESESSGIFNGAYRKIAKELNPMNMAKEVIKKRKII